MTVGKMSAACWTIFIVMCLGAFPLAAGIVAIHALPDLIRVGLAIVVAGGLWWGPFAYAMYLSTAVMKNGDRRLLKRGIHGTAVVLSARMTSTTVTESGEFDWQGSRVYKYRLRVTVPGKNSYETDCSMSAARIGPGSVVNVAVSPRNRKRVTIDVGQGGGGGIIAPGQALLSGAAGSGRLSSPADQRISELERLGKLHSQGILTDTEFAAEKARLFGR